ncbi:hypothetical protein [Pararhizobium sp. LjRoot238]|uniref:hypothetical protein n=1 Tax=Pararhizobium sp. LjRoot238 TaxID=3342293 RepID=UPI003ECDF55C
MAARKANHPLQRYEKRAAALLPPATYTTCRDAIAFAGCRNSLTIGRCAQIKDLEWVSY